MATTLAFDVYGTVVDPGGMVEALASCVGDDAARIATLWRSKQFEYLFRRGLGRKYETFTVCTRQALEYVMRSNGIELSGRDLDDLMEQYAALPGFPDAAPALSDLNDRGFDCFVLSNGEPDAVATLLGNAGLSGFFKGTVSAHEVRSFKPDPSVYAHFLENTGALLGRTWLISAHPFDVIGAMQVGWKAAWVQRDPEQVFDPWDSIPTAVVASLGDLKDVVR